MEPPADDREWIALSGSTLPWHVAVDWAVTPSCGAVVQFLGTVRDHSEGRAGVAWLEYEAYEEHALARMRDVAAEARQQWPEVGRIALLHRTGRLAVTDVAVAVVVSAPHRHEAFEAGRFCIDTLKATVPIWKKEAWQGGEDWGTCAHDLPHDGARARL